MRKAYYLLSMASLGLIAWAIHATGETNLPPLKPLVRYFIIFLYANWMVSYCLLAGGPAADKETFRGWAGVALIGTFLALMFPVFSGDLMEYLIRGRMLGLYHVSPYIAIPKDFPNDLLRPYSIWINNPDSYGPLSVYLQTPPAVLFQKSITGMIWAYKMMVLGFIALAVFYFRKILHLLNVPNANKLWVLFAYCPLFLVTGLIDGHNDIIMMSFSVIALYFLLARRYARAFIFWTCAFLIKYMVVIQLPFMVLYAVKDRWRYENRFPFMFILKHLVINCVLIVLCFAPIWGGKDTFLAILRQSDAFYTNTIPYLFHLSLSWVGLHVDGQLVKHAFVAAFLGLYLYLLVRQSGRPLEDSLSFFRVVSLVYLAFYTAHTAPMGYWYLSWGLFWLVLARWPKELLLLCLYSAVGLLAFYKRINFLTAAAVCAYVAALVWDRIFRRLNV